MINLKLEGLTGSEVLKIKAAVGEIMEKYAGVVIVEDPDIREDPEGICQMSFKKKKTSLEELNKIQDRLGKNFSIDLDNQKEGFVIILKAPKDDFAKLIGKTPAPKQPGLDFNGEGEGKQ